MKYISFKRHFKKYSVTGWKYTLEAENGKKSKTKFVVGLYGNDVMFFNDFIKNFVPLSAKIPTLFLLNDLGLPAEKAYELQSCDLLIDFEDLKSVVRILRRHISEDPLFHLPFFADAYRVRTLEQAIEYIQTELPEFLARS